MGRLFIFYGESASGKSILSRLLDLEKTEIIDDVVLDNTNLFDLIERLNQNKYKKRNVVLIIADHETQLTFYPQEITFGKNEKLIQLENFLKNEGWIISEIKFERISDYKQETESFIKKN